MNPKIVDLVFTQGMMVILLCLAYSMLCKAVIEKQDKKPYIGTAVLCALNVGLCVWSFFRAVYLFQQVISK